MSEGIIYLIIGLIVAVIILWYYSKELLRENNELRSKYRSGVVKYGKNMEHLIPFMKNFPYNPRDLRFLGDPIDFIIFDEDKVILGDFKTGKARLTDRQKKIKEMVNNGKIKWEEFRA